MSYRCKRCTLVFTDVESKNFHLFADCKRKVYGLNLEEYAEGFFIRCCNDRECLQYFTRNSQKEYTLKKGAREMRVIDSKFITLFELREILEPLDINYNEVLKRLPDGSYINPQRVDKQAAIDTAREVFQGNIA